MIPKRYACIFADRSSGAVYRFTVAVRPVIGVCLALLAVPVGYTVQSRWTSHAEIEQLRLQNARLELENSSYRITASELTNSIADLQDGLTELSSRLEVAALESPAFNKLPDSVRAASPASSIPEVAPTDTFDLLGGLLGSVDQRLQMIRHGVALREALSDATPNVWPADGWLSASYGYREDPFTGERDFHPAIDISSRRGQPVYATATGRVTKARRNGDYGNLIQIAHGFGLVTRYGHLADYAVEFGDTVKRGEVIGYVGSTGRATGSHVHYEVLVNGRTLNPLRLLPDTDAISAN
ncbi:MAG TPA: M23 family metallopeptidase [Acidobacteria bacterium]|nr:M23 family metallopeptidase [Acidobacteriota bacterium]